MTSRDVAARVAYLDQLWEMFVDSARLPAVPEKGSETENLSNQIQRSGGVADA